MEEIRSICKAKSFKFDISELCQDCPLLVKIKSDIKLNVDSILKDRKRFLPKDKYIEFLNKEIQKELSNNEKTLKTENANENYKSDPHRPNRINNYILRKEWIKVLSSELKSSESITQDENNKIYSRPNRTDISFYCYYTNETNTLDLKESFPSEKA